VGAVRKLATVVIVGLVALSTLLVVYLAAEPIRRDDETTEQQNVSIERGTSLYITYCLQCHGPAGLGSAGASAVGEEPARTGAVLNQNAIMTDEQKAGQRAVFQSDDPVQQGIAEDWIRYRIMYGAPAEQMTQGYSGPIAMPAFRSDLNVQEINELVYLIMHGDWNYVYNTAVHDTGIAVAQAECLATPGADAAACEAIEDAPPVYPTPPAPANAPDTVDEAAAPEGTPETAPEQEGADEGDKQTEPMEQDDTEGDVTDSGEGAAAPSGDSAAGVEIEALDSLDFSETALTVKPGDTLTLTNAGFLQHDLAVDEWGGPLTPMLNNGETAEFTIPEDAEPGEYEFYCSVAGHKEGGMVGTFTVEAP
jgi:plastocyanin